jgi:hypothetical protein
MMIYFLFWTSIYIDLRVLIFHHLTSPPESTLSRLQLEAETTRPDPSPHIKQTPQHVPLLSTDHTNARALDKRQVDSCQ